MPAKARPPNRLANARSPYLQQHAQNPVDWHPWGSEALDRARREQKPIFLSIGYSACHWCHVMAHESFEDPRIAEILNRLFINIKVDREERPDLDELYMQATLLTNHGQGGWPMSIWLTPDGRPFFAGTYFPPRAAWGRPGFGELCEQIGEFWRTRRDDIEHDAQSIASAVAASLQAPSAGWGALTLEAIDDYVDEFVSAFDPHWGGIASGGTNKFPPPMAIELFLRRARCRSPKRRAQLESVVRTTLDRMSAGGIRDHLAGGFARYSTDQEWHVPHFEKMLYDQALICCAYLRASQYFSEPDYAREAAAILDYVLDDLESPSGGYYSARDADSEGVEGKYYVWTHDEVKALLGADAAIFCRYYDVRPGGNWADPHAPGEAKNVLRIAAPLESVATEFGVDPDAARQRLTHACQVLLQARRLRPAPMRDEKILAEWNGLMIAAAAIGGRVLNQERYIASASRAADYILAHHRNGERLNRTSRDGVSEPPSFLGDYAAMIHGLLHLYEATFQPRWLQASRDLARVAQQDFADQEGGYFTASHDHERLLARPLDLRDAATPSGNSLMLFNLVRLGAMLGDEEWRQAARKMLNRLGPAQRQRVGGADAFMAAADFLLTGPVEVALLGQLDRPDTRALRQVLDASYIPNRVMMHVGPSGGEFSGVPLLRGKSMLGGKATAYVCRNFACEAPTTDADQLQSQLESA